MSFRPRNLRVRLLLVGTAAMTALSMPAAAEARLGDDTLRRGDSGSDVKSLQRELASAGYRLKADGEFGRTTVKRVKAFEGNEELKVDGVITPDDVDALREAADRDDGGSVYREESSEGGDSEGEGTAPVDPDKTTPGSKARVIDGQAVAPADAPQEVKDVIAAGNEIARKPYVYGGGHGKLKAKGYDCSGSISYALRKAGLMKSSLASGPMMKWGDSGAGEWITLKANSGHAYMMVAGVRFDTSAHKREGSRWTAKKRSGSGYVTRHPEGL